MDYIFYSMDFFCKFGSSETFTIHLAHYRRSLDRGFKIQSIGYVPAKTSRTQAIFTTQNFSFILSGAGTYSFSNSVYPVVSPCVITQSPGIPTDYGPVTMWEELYLIYKESDHSAFVKRRLFDPDIPLWNIASTGVLYDHLAQLTRLFDIANEPYIIDKIDMLCEMMILESLSQKTSAWQSREERVVRELEAAMMKNARANFDIRAFAHSHGMHEATLRRYWARFCPLPPDRFLMQLRMGEACRMLVETANTISQIAYDLKFEDPLYFSRRFRKEFGCTATEYREKHRFFVNSSPDKKVKHLVKIRGTKSEITS